MQMTEEKWAELETLQSQFPNKNFWWNGEKIQSDSLTDEEIAAAANVRQQSGGVISMEEWNRRALNEKQAWLAAFGNDLDFRQFLAVNGINISNATLADLEIYYNEWQKDKARKLAAAGGGGKQSVISGGIDNSPESLIDKIRDLQIQVNRLSVNRQLVDATSAGVGVRKTSNLILGQRTQDEDKVYDLIAEWTKANPMREGELPTFYYGALSKYLASQDASVKALEKFGWSAEKLQSVASQVLASLLSALTMLVSKNNFPLAASVYFATQGLAGGFKQRIDVQGNKLYAGTLDSGATWLGQPIGASTLQIEVPQGLPNDIFDEYRFMCFDRLTSRWHPSDEIRPLDFDSNENYRWFILDRVGGKVYKSNWIKKPRIYLQ